MKIETDRSPFVSVILPIRNEARTIRRCLEAILNQDYPAERYELIVVDGMSDDGTREIANEFCERDSRVRMLDSPQRTVPHAMNLGIAASQGEVIVRVDGHAFVSASFLSKSVGALQSSGCACAGGRITSVGDSPWSCASALAMSAVFGVGNSAFRCSGKAGPVDTLAFGAYRSEVLASVGEFDTELVRCQDDEYNYRLRSLGHRIYFDPSIVTEYLCRSSLKGLFKQYFQYGFWKVRVLQKHPKMMQPRQFVPPAAVLGFLLLVLLGEAWQAAWIALVGLLALYVVLSAGFSIRLALRNGWRQLMLLPIVFVTLHLSYGLGFLCGLIRFARRWGESPRESRDSG